MTAEKPATKKAAPEKAAPEPAPRWRRILVVVLLVLGCVLAPISVLAVWTRNTLLSTDQYVDTVAPLAEDQIVTDRLADVAVEALFANVDVEAEIRSVLPEEAAIIAPVVAQAAQQLASEVTHRFLASEEFQTLWRELNRTAHTQVVRLLTGEGAVTGGKVVVDLSPVVRTVQEKLEGLGLDIFSDAKSTKGGTELVLFQSETVEKVQSVVDVQQKLAIVLPILVVLLLAAAIVLSPNRRRTLLQAALGVAVAMAILVIGTNILRSLYLDAFKVPGRDAAGATYDQLLVFLRTSARAAFAAALAVAIGAWVAGPGRVATRIRATAQRVVGGTGDRVGEAGVDLSGAGSVVARYRTSLRVAVVGLGAVVLMVVSRPSGATVLIVAVLILIGLAVIEILARAAPVQTG